MKVFVAGGTGFIGGHVVRELIRRGHNVTCLVRPGSAAAPPEGAAAAPGAWTEPRSWATAVAGHDAVVNCAGIIRERPGATFEAVHTEGATALFEAAREGGVSRVVQISAMGADEQAASRYHLSKRAADTYLAGMGLPYIVLRPSVVYGSGDHSMTFFARLARLPVTPVPGDGKYLLQPLHIADLVRAVTMAVEEAELPDAIVDVGGGTALTFDALLDTLARAQGRRNARKLHIPWPLMRMAAGVTDLLGGRGPITSEELSMLRRGSHGDNAAFVRLFGFEPRVFDEQAARDLYGGRVH
jgi:NADH dehydrogenase